jgi:hypothetical protein
MARPSSYEGSGVKLSFPVSGELRFSRQLLLPTSYPVGSLIPDHDPCIREGVPFGGSILRDGALAGPGGATAAGLGPEIERDECRFFYAVFIFAPSGMTPSVA